VADKSDQGTGTHAHKDSQEPWPHTKGEKGKQASRAESSGMEQGRHHSSGEQRREESERGRQHSATDVGRHSSPPSPTSPQGMQSGPAKGSGAHTQEQDLKEREYRDKQGNVHHHTHTSSEYKDKDRKAS
jgi:hypothetical protein